MSSQENVEAARRAYEAFNRGGVDAVITEGIWSPEIVWDATPTGIPGLAASADAARQAERAPSSSSARSARGATDSACELTTISTGHRPSKPPAFRSRRCRRRPRTLGGQITPHRFS